MLELLMRLGIADFITKEVIYFGACCVNYQNKVGRTETAIKEKIGNETEGNSSKNRRNIMRHPL